MNKIYKVIWSKVRNCYVAVSEIAKRNGKSCTSVNCGAKANHGHVGVALAIALSLSMAGGGVAWGAEVVEVSDATYPEITTDTTGTVSYYDLVRDGGVTFTVGNGGTINYASSYEKSGNIIEIKSGGQVTSKGTHNFGISNNTINVAGIYAGGIQGGYGHDTTMVTNNKVTVSGTIGGESYLTSLTGGYTEGGTATKNAILINGGTVYSSSVTGGVSGYGSAGGDNTTDGNTVTITNGKVFTTNDYGIYGGRVNDLNGTVHNNSVTISGTSIIGKSDKRTYVYGGKAYSGSAEKNKVEISGGTIYADVYGGYSGSGTVGGTNKGNIVNISGGTISGKVYGGWSTSGNATGNHVYLNSGEAYSVYGGYTDSTSSSHSANENEVTIQGTVTSDVNGGNAYKGNVSGNIVYIKSGASVQKVAGGSARDYGSAETNTVEISGGTVSDIVMGGFSQYGIAGGDTKVKGNTVTISAGSVTNHVYGGFSPNSETNNKAIYNTVEIKGGTIGGATKSIYGGYGRKEAQNNTVSITGGTIKSTSIEGGHSISGNATYNTVTIAGGNFNSASSNIYGGYVLNSGYSITNNTINLYGTVTGLNNAGLYGSNYSNTNTTGNELHIGGVKDNTMLATGTQASPWSGTTGNKVTSVNNFNSIVLHKVDWSTTTPVLAAGSFNNNFTSDGYLDISGMTFTGTPNYGSLALLKSDASSDFTTLRLKYNSGAAVQLNSNKPKQIKQAGTSKSESSSTNGVKFAYNQKEHVVSLDVANSYKNVLYSVVDNVTGITFDSMTWGTGRDLSQATHHYDFSNATTINASNLTFAKLEEGALSWFNSPSIKTGTEMTLIANATGITAGNSITQPTTGKGTVSIQLPCAGMFVDATAKGTVSAGTDVVKYVVDEVKVGKLTLGETDWADSYGLSFKNWGWKLASDAVIDATNMTYKKTYSIKKVGDKHSVVGLNISGTASINNIIMPSSGKVSVPNTVNSDSAITFDATAYGDVIFEDNTVKTKITSVALDKVTLGTYSWGTSKNMPDSSWTASASTKIDDTNFAYTGNANTKLKKNDTAVILNATGLATNSEVIRDSGASANKTVGMNFIDNGENGSGFNFVGTVNGHVEAAADKVNYVVDSVTLNNINLAAWTGTAYNIASADNWVLSKDAQNKVDAVVNTSVFSLPGSMTLATGEQKVIISADDAGYFENIKLTGDNVWNGSPEGSTLDSTAVNGVAVIGNQTKGGIKVNEANTSQIIYESSKKNVTGITLGTVPEFKYDGTAARTFDNEHDVSNATINATGFSFEDTSPMEAGDVMTIIDATNALTYATSGQTLKDFDTVTFSNVAFTDTITDPTNSSATDKIEFTGKHTDTLSLNEASAGVKAKTKLIYTVGDKVVDTATLSGPITWSDGGTYYTNGTAANQKNRNSVFTFDANSKIDISGVDFTATTDPLNKTMTLISGNTINSVAKNVAGSFTDGKDTPRSFGVALSRANGTLEAKASGFAEITTGGNLTYTVNGVAIDKINVTSITNDADTVPDDWTLAKDSSDNVIATVETDGLVVASPSGLEPGETKVIMEAASGSTAFFKDVSVNGSHAWKVDGSTITSDLDIGGVAITGTQTKGGVKVNEANTNQIIYEESKKSINTLTLGSVTFANDDGTVATVARAFDKTYDVSTATINADDLAFSNSDIMETGNSMRIVDASAAIPNAISNKKLSAFAGQTYEVAFSDTITGKNLTLKGTHTDTLSQDAAQTTLTYTVGDKKVSTATLNGTVNWSDGASYYTNGTDVNQNNVAATYTFDGNTSVDISSVSFNAAADPLAGATKTMTLLKGVTGVLATKVSGTPSFTVSLDQMNTKLDANATGASDVSGNDVTFTVSGVTLDKITVKSANGTADKVPANWTMAAGATIETDSMTVPELAAGTHVDILQSDTDGFFAKVAINGANAYGNTQDAFTESDAAKSVTIAGTQDKGVTLNTEKKHLIYKAGTLDVASVTLGPAEWKKGATIFDRSGAGYNYAGVAALGTDGFAISYASPETVATGDSMTLLQANATLKDMAEQLKQTSYSFAPVSGVTIDANITGKLATSGGAVTYTAATNQAAKLTFTSVDWKDSGALMTRPSNITFAGADVDTAKIHFQNVKELDANRKMTLVSDFGDSVGTITGTKYTVGAGLEGEGAASLSGSDLVFTTKTGARDLAALAQTHNTLMVMEAGMAVLAAGNEYVGQTMAELANPQNVSLDGTVTAASLGGSKSRYKTGSHVDSNNWNVAVAVGSKRELKKGSLEWGVFGEYGKSNYTLHSDAGRGDGDSHYAGGGLMAKWTNKHDVYTEASVRLGRLNDTASNLLRDAAGNGYGYDVHANYFGAHVGIGKIIRYKGGKSLDVYGKYFYTKRDGVDFTSGGNNYSLDSVASSILRVGARYGTTDKKWNWYGGLAYEYEFDGKSEGTVDGVGIRAASIKGGSVRGEIGLRMSATKTNPWQTDISIYGYGGKHRGFGGSVNVAYMF